MLYASAAVPTRTARIHAAQKITGIRSTTRTVVAAIRLNRFALMVPLDSNPVARLLLSARSFWRPTLTPFLASVKGLCGALYFATVSGHAGER